MTVRGMWGQMDFVMGDQSFEVILNDSKDEVQVPFRKDMGPEMALRILELCDLQNTEAARQLILEIDKMNVKRARDQEIILWLKETKSQTGAVVTSRDRIEFARQEKFWRGGEGC